jgi:hypothetical protein
MCGEGYRGPNLIIGQPTHKLYLDNFGNKDYSPDGRYSKQDERTSYFVFGEALLIPEEASVIDWEMGALKMETFGVQEVHRSKPIGCEGRRSEERAILRFGVPKADLAKFSESRYEHIGDSAC